ncbi:YdcF family protein [Pseudodesulfovibrio sp.]|nr:YdcF family protein [Pseudodesulfovibrio sp.]
MKFIRFTLQSIGALAVTGLLTGFCLIFFAGYWMNVNDDPIQADYILPLAGDGHRMLKAAELYRQGYAPVILLSNSVKKPPSRLQQLHWKMGFPKYSREQYLGLLLPLVGAETAKLEPFGDGHVSTVEEAEALRQHLNGEIKKLLIVTSPYHARRAKMIFEEILPDCTLAVTVTEEDSFEPHWWKNQRSAQNLIMEFAKTVHYLMGGAFRSTDKQDENTP